MSDAQLRMRNGGPWPESNRRHSRLHPCFILQPGRYRDLIAIKPHAHTSRTLRRTARLDMNYMTRTAPFGRRLMGDFFWHFESEMYWRALAKGQVRCKGYPPCRNIQR